MKKKRLTVAEKKIAELVSKLEDSHVRNAEYAVKIDDLESDKVNLKASIKEKLTTIETAAKLLRIATQGRLMPMDTERLRSTEMFYGRETRDTARQEPEQELLSLAVAANTALSTYEGERNERNHLEQLSQLDKVDVQKERETLIKLAMENPRDYAIQTDEKSGMVNIYRHGDGRRIL